MPQHVKMEPRIREVGSLLFINLTLLKYITVLKYISLCINSSVFKLDIGFTVVCFVWINVLVVASSLLLLCLQCFDAVGWAAGRASGL